MKSTFTNTRIFNLLIFAVILLFTIASTEAATKTWIGSVSEVWGTATNWSGGTLPLNTDDIIIPSGCVNYPFVTTNWTMNSLTINFGGSITFTANTATVNGGEVNNAGTILINGGTLDIKNTSGNLTNAGLITTSSGQLKVGGTVTNNAGANFNTSGGTVTVSTNGSTNSGTISVSSGTLNFNGRNITNLTGGTINQTGGILESSNLIINASSNVNFSTGASTFNGTFTNYGTVTASSGTPTLNGLLIIQTGGNLLVNGGTLIVRGAAANENYGTITVSSGTLNLATNNNDLTVFAGGNLNQTGGAVTIRNLTINSAATPLAAGNLTFSGSTSNITGDLTNSGTATLNGGSVNIAGNITNNASGDFTIGGAAVASQNDATNYGIMSVSSGSLDLATAGKKLIIDGSTATRGIFNQYAGSLVKTDNLELKNNGTYNQFGGEVQIDHDLKVPAGSTFAATGGTVNFTGNAGAGADYTGNVQFYNFKISSAGNPKINANETIKIAGNFVNENTNLNVTSGIYIFNGTTPQTITSAAPANTNKTLWDFRITNPAGVTLLSDLGVKAFSYTPPGYLNTNGKNFYVDGSIYTGPLPVELTSFSASIIGSTVKLTWATATEVNNYGFEVERKVGSLQSTVGNFEKIDFVNGNGNSNSPKSYSFVDDKISKGKYSYRLKQIDNDGKFEYSKVIEVDLGGSKEFELSQNYPNPFNPATTIRFSLPEAGNVKLILYNILGQEIKTLINEFKESGVHSINFNASDLNSGLYIYKLESGSFTQTRKMTLLK